MSAFVKGLKKNGARTLVNIVGIYSILTYSVYSYRVQESWTAKQQTLEDLRGRHDEIKSKLNSEEWLEQTTTAIVTSAINAPADSGSPSILGKALSEAIPATKEQKEAAVKASLASYIVKLDNSSKARII